MTVRFPLAISKNRLALCVMTFIYVVGFHAQASEPLGIPINYGVIEDVEVTTAKTAVKRNVIVGGLIGAAIGGKWHLLSGAAGGAGAGVAATGLLEGDRRIFLYSVTTESDELLSVALEAGGLAAGECVAIEQGKYVNLRRVSSVHCEHAGHKSLNHPDVHEVRGMAAQSCAEARSRSIEAAEPDAIDAALKQVRALCES